MFSTTKTLIDDKMIGRLLRNAFGSDAEAVEITELTEGMFNAIYSVRLKKPLFGADSVILKLGIQEGKHVLHYEKDIMRTELFVYDLLPKIGVPSPKVYYVDTSRALIDCDYFFMEKLAGDNLGHLSKKISSENMAEIQKSLGEYTARLHSVTGPYFGYIKEDASYHYLTWREAFKSFIDRMVEDGIRDGVKLPYDTLYAKLEPYWPLLDEVKTPSLVNFDMWASNIMVKEENGVYVIDGIIDNERAFYGDPAAEFLSSQTICGPIEDALHFQEGYSRVRPFSFNENDKMRLKMYEIYVALMISVEVYRCDEASREKDLEMRGRWFMGALEKL